MPASVILRSLPSCRRRSRALPSDRSATGMERSRRSAQLGLALALTVAGCQGSSETPAVRVEGCPRCGDAAQVGALRKGDIDECSGAVSGSLHPDVLYVHNDSGDEPRFFAIDFTGAPRGEFTVVGASAIDWEDVARGPCGAAGGSCLFFGDIGDNDADRDSYAIYRVKEPDTLDGEPRAVTAEVISFSYPDGKSHDTETLLVHPITGAITVVTKVKKDGAGIYELATPPAAGQPVVLVEVGSVAAPVGNPRFTGGDVHSEGRGVLLRTNSNVFFYAMTPDQTVAQALAGAPCTLPLAEEEQGESIAWVPGGWDYMTISEGAESPIGRVSCQLR